MKKQRLRQWMAWRDDYRCARPPVSCQGCDTYSPPNKHANVMVFEGYRLVRCSKCQTPRTRQTEPEILFPHVYRRVNRDVVCRYIRRFSGSTFSVQTAADDCEIYLRDRHGKTIATVSLFDRYPKPPADSVFADMPYETRRTGAGQLLRSALLLCFYGY